MFIKRHRLCNSNAFAFVIGVIIMKVVPKRGFHGFFSQNRGIFHL